ncbi:hypothetical protein LIER_36422 [Lithospermum erythrorhizon]|uniref:Uncharacterized protein n=1 Tax=Lithospermum erythrorhizon TaxID=34254 RepID=A0AAV3P9H6_LITER
MGHLIRQCPILLEWASPQKHVVYGLWIKAPAEKSRVEFRLIVDGFNHAKPSLPWEEKKIYSSGMVVVNEGKLLLEFSPGFEPAVKTGLNIQNSNLTKSLAFIEGVPNEKAVTSSGFNVEVSSNGREDFSNPTSLQFKSTLTTNHLDTIAPIITYSKMEVLRPHGTAGGFMETIKFFDFQNMAPIITQPEESSLQSMLLDGRRLLKGSHSKGLVSRKRHHPYLKDDGAPSPGKKPLFSDSRLEDNRDLDSTAEAARQPSRSS